MTTSIAIRLQAEGSAEIKRAFDDVGNAGKTAFDGVTNAMDRTGAEADQVVRKVREATEAARVAQTSANTATGPGSPAAPLTPASVAPSATTAQINRIRSQLDDEFRTQQQAERAGRLIAHGEDSGQFTPAYAERLRTLADRKYGPQNDNKAEGLNTYDRLFVKYQAIDSAQQLYAGASPALVGLQQGGQVFQQLADREGGLTAGLKQLGVTAAGLVTPFALAGTAAVAATATFALAASSYSRDQTTLTNSLKLNGRTTDATVAQLDTLARSNADAGKVSTSTAREIAAGYASTGEIGTSVLDTLIQKTGDYARLTGQDVPAATAELARMFSDPAKGAEDLGNKLGGVDDKTRQYIQTLAEMGDKIGAQTALSEAFRAQVAANTDQTTRWGQAWNFVSSTADKAWESIKRAAGGAITTPQQALESLEVRLGNAEKNAPDSAFTRNLRAEHDAARAEVNKVAADEAKRVADAQSAKDSVAAAGVARGLDPQFNRLSEIDRQTTTLRDALSNPDTRNRMDPAALEAAERAYNGLVRARETMVDTNGKLVTSEEIVRRQGALSVEAAKATTAEEKAAVAEKQKQLELLGKTVSRQSASEQISTAGAVARIGADSKGGGKSSTDPDDDFDRAVKQTENSIRKQQEQAETYGQTADVVARYRAETELLTAAKRAERDITPDLTAKIKDLSDQSAQAAKRNEDLKDTMRTLDTVRSTGSDGIRTLISDLQKGASAGTIFNDVLGRISTSLSNFVGDQISEGLFGRRGTSSGWLADLVRSGFGSNASSVADLSESSLGTSAVWAANGRIPGYADGRPAVVSAAGIISGPGGPTTDSIPAWVSDREAIIRASAVDHYGPEFIRSINDRTYDPKIFLSAPRHANGLTSSGDYTVPSGMKPASANPAPVVFAPNIIPPAGYRAETREVDDGQGGRKPEITFAEITARGIRSPQGQAALRQQSLARR